MLKRISAFLLHVLLLFLLFLGRILGGKLEQKHRVTKLEGGGHLQKLFREDLEKGGGEILIFPIPIRTKFKVNDKSELFGIGIIWNQK